MWKGYYGKEPFDLRLTALRVFTKLPVIIAVTVLGSLLFGGGYYVKNVLLRGDSQYAVTSRFRIEYAVAEEKDVGVVYINEVSWNTYLQTELVLDAVRKHMTDTTLLKEWMETDNVFPAEALKAVLASDLRVLATVVTTDSPEKSLWIAGALEQALTEEFAEEIREIVSIEVIDSGNSAKEVIPDVRVGRAFILSGVLSCFFVFIILLLMETGDDSIWLPTSLWKRYGLKALGTVESRELAENVRYFFRQSGGQVALCASEEGIDLKEVLRRLREKCFEAEGIDRKEALRKLMGKGSEEGIEAENVGTEGFAAGEFDAEDPEVKWSEAMLADWTVVTERLSGKDVCSRLRKAGGILLVVRAGRHAGRRLEHVLEYLEQQDCQVTAALLWGADEKLLKRYYWSGRGY